VCATVLGVGHLGRRERVAVVFVRMDANMQSGNEVLPDCRITSQDHQHRSSRITTGSETCGLLHLLPAASSSVMNRNRHRPDLPSPDPNQLHMAWVSPATWHVARSVPSQDTRNTNTSPSRCGAVRQRLPPPVLPRSPLFFFANLDR
jgi:hypothetical protein